MTTLAGLSVEKVSDRTEDYLKALFYGVPGVGKTYLAATASLVEEMSPVLFIDIEGGVLTLRKDFPDVQVIRIKAEYPGPAGKTILGWEKLSKVYEALTVECPYKTIVLDSLTEASKLSMRWVLKATVAKDPERDPDIPAQRDYLKNGELIKKLVRGLRDLDNVHVIFTAHEQDQRDMDKITKIVPSLHGKLAFEIPGFLDLVGYLYTKVEKDGEVKRKMLTQPIDKYISKSRGGNLPVAIEDPHMGKIAELMLKS